MTSLFDAQNYRELIRLWLEQRRASGRPITFADIDRPADRLIDALYDEQETFFGTPMAAEAAE